jgi:hypothetical protein
MLTAPIPRKENRFSVATATGSLMADELFCDTCERAVDRAATTRIEPYGDLDPTKWQSLCCPDCGRKLQTVFVGRE